MEIAGWQQQWRVPAFGESNYSRYEYGMDGYTAVNPCFDVVAMRMTNALPPGKPIQRPWTAGRVSRHRRIPAFGEWNRNTYDNGSWPAAATPFFDHATEHKSPKAERREGEKGVAEMKWLSVEAHGRRLSKVADSSAYLSRKSCFTVVAKAIDDDLYGIPPDMLYQKPAGKRGWLKMLTGCFCRGGACIA